MALKIVWEWGTRGIWVVHHSVCLPWTWRVRDSRVPMTHRQVRGHMPIPPHSLQYHMDPRLDRSDDEQSPSWNPLEIKVRTWRGAPLERTNKIKSTKLILTMDFRSTVPIDVKAKICSLRDCKLYYLYQYNITRMMTSSTIRPLVLTLKLKRYTKKNVLKLIRQTSRQKRKDLSLRHTYDVCQVWEKNQHSP